ncbi:MAG: serine hydrolase [Gemmatimonadota bacterium]
MMHTTELSSGIGSTRRARRWCLVLALALTACDRGGTGSAAASAPAPYPHANEPIGTVRESYDGTLSDEMAVHTFRNIDRLFPTRGIEAGPTSSALPARAQPLPPVTFESKGATHSIEDYFRDNRVAAILVLDHDSIALERYFFGNSQQTRWMSMSIAKSITSTLIGAAIHDGAIGSVDDSVTHYVPALEGTAYEGATIRDVLMMSSGVKWIETYTDSTSDRRHLLEAQISQVPGSALSVMAKLPRAASPGTRNNYSTGETQVAAEILHGAIHRSLSSYLSERIWQPMGMEAEARWWLDSPDGIEIGGSGISATLRDYGRFGLFLLHDGVANGVRILPEGWAQKAGSAKMLRDGTRLPYGYMWWIPPSAAARRDGAFAAEGIHGQYVFVDPAAKVVIVVWSAQPKPTGGEVYDDLAVFDAIVAALR